MFVARRCVAALVMSAALIASAAAAPRDEDLFIRPEDQHTVMFGSLDAGRSVFAAGGVKQTLTGPLDRSGFVAMETSGYGLTRERLRAEGVNAPAQRLTFSGSALGGHQWAQNGLYVAAFAGPEVRWEQLAYAGRIERLSRPRPGARGQIEVWARPSAGTMLTATVVAGTARTEVWSRISAGWRIYRDAFIGPELTVYATPTYVETRIGGHVTGLAIGLVTVRLSGGWQHDDAHRHGAAYGALSAWLRL